MKIMERGQITIPKKIREKYGLKPSTEVDILPVEEGVLIIKRSSLKSPLREINGILNNSRSSDSLVEEIRGR